MIKNIFLIYIFCGLLLVLWDMRHRILARLLRSQEHNIKAITESHLYVNDHGIARLKAIIGIISIWPIRIYISAKRIFRAKHTSKK